MFDPDQFHDPEFRNLVRAARAVVAERVRRGVATPAERLAVAALDEMPDEEDPDGARLVVRHVIILGHGLEFTACIVDDSQHRTPECLVMAKH